jgi:hypothetical protein
MADYDFRGLRTLYAPYDLTVQTRSQGSHAIFIEMAASDIRTQFCRNGTVYSLTSGDCCKAEH